MEYTIVSDRIATPGWTLVVSFIPIISLWLFSLCLIIKEEWLAIMVFVILLILVVLFVLKLLISLSLVLATIFIPIIALEIVLTMVISITVTMIVSAITKIVPIIITSVGKVFTLEASLSRLAWLNLKLLSFLDA